MNIETPQDRMQRYSEIIIEHSQFPHHHGRIESPTHEGQGENPFCGDRLTLQLKVDDDGVIQQAAVESVGCAISMASASLLASHLHGLKFAQAESLYIKVHQAVIDGPGNDLDESLEESLGELAALSFAGRYPSRVKCATLPWHVLKHVLAGNQAVATTEEA